MEPDSYGKGIVTNSSVMFEFVYIDNSNLIVNTCFYNVENKRKTEVKYFSGTLIKIAKEHNVEVPVNEVLYNFIKAKERNYTD